MSRNNISGSIPPEIGNWIQLHVLDFSLNHIVGAIPKELGKLTSLKKLWLNGNHLSGAIPVEFESLTNLEFLDISLNKLCKSRNLGNDFSKLNHLNLSHNNFSEELPILLMSLFHLSKLDLSYNSLTGEIPSKVSKMQSLEVLNLSHNYLSSIIPTTFEEMHGLLHVDISYNELHGLIPNSKAFLDAPLEALQDNRGLRKKDRYLQLEQSNKHEGGSLFVSSTFDGRKMDEEVIRATDAFNDIYCIGKGGYGTTYQAKFSSGEMVAVKKLHQLLDDEKRSQKAFLNEIKALTEIEEYAKEFDWSKRLNIIKGVAYALSYMHHDCSPPIIHRDIKSNNVLLDSQYVAHVSDFGTAKILELDLSNWTSLAGIYGYMAPELAYTMKITEKSDVYSFGVLSLEVLMGKYPDDFIFSLKSSPSVEMGIQLKDVLDQRLQFPAPQVEAELIRVAEIATECLNDVLESRPTMHIISKDECCTDRDGLSVGRSSSARLVEAKGKRDGLSFGKRDWLIESVSRSVRDRDGLSARGSRWVFGLHKRCSHKRQPKSLPSATVQGQIEIDTTAWPRAIELHYPPLFLSPQKSARHIIPSRGLRQGDPISPYLFLLYTEGLIGLLKHVATSNAISGIRVSRGAPKLNHLLFADDSLIFCDASVETNLKLLRLLKLYEEASGQFINQDKSAMVFS
ncbi:MDIS1-interacting receptor like kinase 2-like [Juglans microcarpa x Juglans regia]|uniref:MDIS1-interacting receptor like kinase 2-like n=1 Tax=Juglans microcarpa x Juglans regia TaxID=2249226 RepID=UPI001B7E1DC9|nr:MDIS1-interacting receptor like kinase 2-like [Juglans microcarpa x Juglans regia]